MPDFLPLIHALSHLNVHARAWGSGKRAIYAYKTFVAAALAETAEPVFVMVRCQHCDGTGQYRDWDGYDRGRCYRCTKGIVTLRFIESRIGDVRWHHPTNAGGHDVLNAVWGVVRSEWREPGDEVRILADGTERVVSYRQAEGWGPHMPAAKLPIEEACRLLNLVEATIDTVPTDRLEARWARARALAEINRYPISLERIDEPCFNCGAKADLTNCCSTRWGYGYAEFARPMCPACHGRGTTLRWPTKPAEASLTPAVREWLAHPLRQRERVSRDTWE